MAGSVPGMNLAIESPLSFDGHMHGPRSRTSVLERGLFDLNEALVCRPFSPIYIT